MVTKCAVLAVASLTLSVHALVAQQEPMQKDYLVKGPEHGILDASAKREASKIAVKAAPVKPHESGSQLKLRKAKQPAAAEASQSLTKVSLPFNGTSVASRVAGLEGADLNLLQVGLSMQSKKMDKAKATSMLDLDSSTRLSLLAQADEMLKKDLAQHRAKVQQWKANWKANRTSLTRHRREQDSVSAEYADYLDKRIKEDTDSRGWYAVKMDAALGTGLVLKTLIEGGDSEAVKQQAIQSAITVVSAVASMSSPMLGLAVTMATTLLSGFIPGQEQSSPMQSLYEAVMAQVQTMISQAILQSKMDTVKDKITGIVEELHWVPDLLEQLSSEVKMSYLLTVQHDLATNVRAVFGECFDNRALESCKSWEEAGTIDLALNFAELHLNLLSVIYSDSGNSGSSGRRRSSSSSVSLFQKTLAHKAYSLTKNYRCLLYHSYLHFRTKRLADLKWATSTNNVCTSRLCNRNRRRKSVQCDATCCSYSYKVKDQLSGKEWHNYKSAYAPPNFQTNGCGDMQSKKDWIWNKANEDMNTDLESNYRAGIDNLVGSNVLSAIDNRYPCGDKTLLAEW